VFKLTPPTTIGGAWTENVILRFNGRADEEEPYAGLIGAASGALYGTAGYGGANCGTLGGGTVFEIMP
jgi:hypothetical protein